MCHRCDKRATCYEAKTMNILITGGAGFIGDRLARTLLARQVVAGRRIQRLVLTDQFPARDDLLLDPRVHCRVGPLLDEAVWLREQSMDCVFHLVSAVSGECETDFELGLCSNLDSTRALLDALRAKVNAGAAPARLVFASSVAVYGPDAAVPLPAIVSDTTLPTPQTSYGIQKLICEQLVADYNRKGYLDGRSARLMTVTVRPGRPNGAASSFFSSIIREPLAGQESVCPVAAEVCHPVSSPQRAVDGLIAVLEASRKAYCGRTAMNLPALNISIAQMLDALSRVAGPKVRARVRFERDDRIAGIVSRWPSGARADRAAALGLRPDESFDDIIGQYILDQQENTAALAGLND